ncbi:N-acetylmuramidase domain-containing protein [Photobacterium kagoshimensis]
MAFIVSCGLKKHLTEKNWAQFAKGYNGSEYKKNKYDTKLAEAYKKHAS